MTPHTMLPESEVACPLANINGTAPAALIEECCTALERLREARDALAAVTVNGRDFQTAELGRFRTAYQQHNRRLTSLAHIMREVEIMAESVAEQQAARAATQRRTP